MLIELAFGQVFWLNSFPNQYGISNTLSPRTIMTGKEIDFNLHVRLAPGQYVQTHEEHTNDMNVRTLAGIALRPTGNDQGGHFFLSLPSGRVVNRNSWTELPMPDGVIDAVHRLARRQKQGFRFTYNDNTPIEATEEDNSDSESDPDYVPSDESSSDEEDDDDDAP